MKKRTLAIGLATLSGGVILTTGAINAYQGNPDIKGPNYSPEHHEQMMEIFENKDFSAWKELVGDRPIAEKITDQESFEKFTQMRELHLNGQHEEARELGQELGFGEGHREGYGRGYKNGMRDMYRLHHDQQ